MTLIPDLGELLNDELTRRKPGGPSYASGIRTPIVFTSTLRQIRQSAERSIGDIRSVGTFSAFSGISAQNDLTFLPEIIMAINPKSVTFEQPKRFSKKDTRDGSVFFHFTNSKGQNNDILTMQFQGNTGNIDRRGDRSGVSAAVTNTAAQREQNGSIVDFNAGEGNGSIQKLVVWHNLYLLSREPMLLDDGTENKFTVAYISPLLPTSIEFTGFFNEVLRFTETAEKPHSRDYSFSFTVTDTSPDLDELLEVLTTSLDSRGPDDSDTPGFIIGPNTETFGV